jgi:hypothetical protein
MLYSDLEYLTMDKIQKASGTKYNTPLLENFRISLNILFK